MTEHQSPEQHHQHQSSRGPHDPARDPVARRRAGAARTVLIGAVSGIAVLALIGCVVLIGGKTITIGNSRSAASTGASATSAPAATPAAGRDVVTKVVTRWRTRTVTTPVMEQVTVPDPSGSGTMDEGWRADIPCIYVPSAGLLLGATGAAAGAVNETCTLTVVQLQPYADGQAVIVKDSSGHESNWALSPAS